MPSQKLKRVLLGIVAFLILAVVFWFSYNVFSIGTFRGSVFVLSARSAWMASALCSFGIAFIFILGLYFIAKILIEIFKE